MSQDGEAIFFTTTEKLVPGDTDTKQDVYERVYDSGLGEYVTREVSIGPVGGNDAYEAFFERISADGKQVFFSTFEPLVSTDTDVKRDVYVRHLEAGTTEIVSKGDPACAPCGNGAVDADFAGATGDGEAVFFVTSESLAAADQDSSFDVYERDLAAGTTKLVSAAASSCGGCGNGAFTAAFWGVSANGTEAYFTTPEQLSNADGDSTDDIYARDLAAGTHGPRLRGRLVLPARVRQQRRGADLPRQLRERLSRLLRQRRGARRRRRGHGDGRLRARSAQRPDRPGLGRDRRRQRDRRLRRGLRRRRDRVLHDDRGA